MEAEFAVVEGDFFSAHAKYVSAIALSREAGLMMQVAVTNERAGLYFLSRNDEESALTFLRNAVTGYKDWGATAKVEQMENEFRRYPTLFA